MLISRSYRQLLWKPTFQQAPLPMDPQDEARSEIGRKPVRLFFFWGCCFLVAAELR